MTKRIPGRNKQTKKSAHVRKGSFAHDNTARGNIPTPQQQGRWVAAKDLRIGDEVLLSNGQYAIIEKIEVETLSEPETTYNFEVADFHTYYVSQLGVLVHNRCKLARNMKKAGVELKPNEDAHHLYPQQFADKFRKIGIEVDDAVNGLAMEHTKHIAGAQAYNKLWAKVINTISDPATAEMYMKQFMEIVYDIII